MGNCCGSPVENPTPVTTGDLSIVVSNLSQTTSKNISNLSQTTSNNISNLSRTTSNNTSSGECTVSRNSQFSAASGEEASAHGQILPTPNLRIFSYLELKVATRNFRPDTVLGEGGFGMVFKGWLEDKAPAKSGKSTVIAVKKLSSESLQGFEEWQVN